MTAPALVEVAADQFTAMRAMSKMRVAGFALSVRDDRLIVAPADRLSEKQRDYIRTHKPALVALLMDAETLHAALALAGPAGLSFHEGTPGDWDNARLLAAGEVLYGDGRMVNRNDRRYLRERASPIPDTVPDTVPAPANVIPIARNALSELEATL